ncbi:hypothetical protein NM208_g3689 [Fusarium decemcellulare]|uniref:Uncharacterized protein n=1 Tax=Fusarium decemcellulare TaxID=57161 RepID=A0ACC1SNP7_9HYPO|nr:hypothetical protein NM208_g3689 [Fusarium decemcellulare]
MTKDWEPYQDEIRRLYQVEGKKLGEVMRLIKGKYGFIASTVLRLFLTPPGRKAKKARPQPRPAHPSAFSGPAGFPIFQTNSSLPVDLPAFSTLENLTGVTGADFGSFSQPLEQDQTGLDGQDVEGKTQLHRATLSQDHDRVRMLLHEGAAVHIKDHSGNAPLHYAVITGRNDMIQLLLQFGAETDAKGPLGRSPLHLAVDKTVLNTVLVSLLLEQGADPSVQDDRGDTPLHLALSAATSTGEVSYSQTPLIESFLKHGADVNIANNAGLTPFLRLLDQPYSSVVLPSLIDSFLQAGGSILHGPPHARTPFQSFLARSQTLGFRNEVFGRPKYENDILRSFLTKGASILTPTPSREPLIIEYFKNHYPKWGVDKKLGVELCGFITSDKPEEISNLVLREILGRLRNSSFLPSKDLLETLLQKGADPNLGNEKQETLLIVLSSRREPRLAALNEVLILLVAHGADPWRLDSSGKCALFEAAKRYPRNGHTLVRTMLEPDLRPQGSSASTQDVSGGTARRECWQGWEQAIKAVDWPEAKQHILRHEKAPPPKAINCLIECCFSVLGKKHVHLAREKFRGDHGEVELRRRYVAGILQDCRERGVSLDESCTEYLVELCLS